MLLLQLQSVTKHAGRSLLRLTFIAAFCVQVPLPGDDADINDQQATIHGSAGGQRADSSTSIGTQVLSWQKLVLCVCMPAPYSNSCMVLLLQWHSASRPANLQHECAQLASLSGSAFK